MRSFIVSVLSFGRIISYKCKLILRTYAYGICKELSVNELCGLHEKLSIHFRRGQSVTLHATGICVTKVRNFHHRRQRSLAVPFRRPSSLAAVNEVRRTVGGDAWDRRACPRGLPRRWRPARVVTPSSALPPLWVAVLISALSSRQRTCWRANWRSKTDRQTARSTVLGHLRKRYSALPLRTIYIIPSFIYSMPGRQSSTHSSSSRWNCRRQ